MGRSAVHEQELAAEQANAVGTVLHAALTSVGSSMLALRSTAMPSSVTAGGYQPLQLLPLDALAALRLSSYSASTCWSGLTMTRPLSPSTINRPASRISERALCRGDDRRNASERATIAV